MKIIVVGGGPAGCTAARLLAKNFDDVTLIEKANDIGYQASCPFVRLKFPKHPNACFLTNTGVMKAANVKLELNTEVTRVDFIKQILYTNSKEYNYDKLILATGSRNKPLPGTLSSRSLADVKQLQSTLNEKSRVAIIGSSAQALKLAETLTELKAQVTIFEKKSHLQISFDEDLENHLIHHLHKIKLLLNTAFDPKSAYDFTHSINFTQEQISLVPKNALMPPNALDNVFEIGSCSVEDCTQSYAFSQAVFCTSEILGKTPSCPRFLKNVQFEVFGHYYARVGMTKEEAKSKYQNVKSVTVADSYRAEFMPTHHIARLTLVFDDDSKRILGCQVTSKHDVTQYGQIAAIIVQKEVTVLQLILQDFFFQPHFGKPLHLFNVCAVAAVGTVPPYEEYKQVM